MLQAPALECLVSDPFSLQQDDLATSAVDVGVREVAEAFVEASVIILANKIVDLRFEIAGR